MTYTSSLKSLYRRHRRLFDVAICILLLGAGWLALRTAFDYLNGLIDHQPVVAQTIQQQTEATQPVTTPEPEKVTDAADVVQKTSTSVPTTPPPVRLPPKPVANGTRVAENRLLLHTVGGDILLALYPDVAPVTVKSFIEWASMGIFDTTHFGRLEPGFVLQASLAQDRLVPLSKEQEKSIHTLPGEFSKTLKHRRGVISMGRDDGKPDSATTSYSILLGDALHLDGSYTIFGQVEAGLDVLERLSQVPREPGSNRPASRLTILSVEVIHQDDLSTVTLEKPRSLTQIEQQLFPNQALTIRAIAIFRQHCWKCHGGESVKGELDLTSQKSFLTGGHHGPLFQKNDLDASILIKRLLSHDEDRMPPKGNGLHSEEIKAIGRWLNIGAPYPSPYALRQTSASGSTVSTAAQSHWAWQPWKTVTPPTINNLKWCSNEIDRFILAKLENSKLQPNPRAADTVLARRLAYDLTGLPPMAVLPASSKIDYAKSVDQLLNSPRFGEHQARHWLDLVRYADSDGYEDDKNRPRAYAYRDFVIRAFNDDLPFDQFLRWQMAGDEEPTPSPQARSATGFLAAGPYQTFAPRKKDRYDELDDIVTTTSAAFLGMTVGCARCHDHKHDPITQHDYHRLVSVFHGSNRVENYLDDQAGQKYHQLRGPVDLVKKDLETLAAPAREQSRNQKIDGLPIKPEEKAVLRQPVDPGNALQVNLLHRYEHLIQVSDDDARGMLADNLGNRWVELAFRIQELEQQLPPAPARGLMYLGSHIAPAPILTRGDPDREQELVPPGFLSVLTRGRPVWNNETWRAWGSTPRTALANWLTDTEAGAGQLVARVIVNRIWQQHFGQGLVRTANDFGLHGEQPSHPELLDWLAQEFVASGWKMKRLHRMIVMSAAWQLSSDHQTALVKTDPENRLLGRHMPQRLTAESLRDSILATCGSLNDEMYGPPVKPPIPPEAIFQTAPKHGVVWPENAQEFPGNWRRSIYICAKRSNPVPFLQLFDAPDTAGSCARRNQSVVPTQAMALLNDHFIRTQATLLAEKIHKPTNGEPLLTVTAAYQSILGRAPTTEEITQITRFVQRSKPGAAALDLPALTDLCHVLMMTNEFFYVN
ncbi:MAG TPA: DUF1553 domain-containing protein [Gemmatales bacterium]|nr:DUF1553 domain-containing protein [Gemmatales bacterium]